MFPDSDPRVWARYRKRALDLLLNTDINSDGALRELSAILSRELGHGAVAHDGDWDALRLNLRAVVGYVLDADLTEDQSQLLTELFALSQVQFHLGLAGRSLCTTLTEGDGNYEPPATSSILTIAAELMWTVQFLKDHGALEVRECKHDECKRLFVDLKGTQESCSDDCRIRYAQGR